MYPARGAQGKSYPEDAGICVCSTGKYTIYNPKTIDPAAEAIRTGTPVTVNQGYTKCSVCVVTDDAIITADSQTAVRAKDAGMNVLKIAPGNILLAGFSTGFIGGASFRINKNTLAFTGTLYNHPDEERIMAFLAENGVKAVFLTDQPIFDIGGAVALP